MTKIKQINRREFLEKSGAGILGSVLAISIGAGCAITKTYRSSVQNGRIVIETRQHPELLIAGGSIIIEPDGMLGPIILINTDGKTFNAVSAVCAHMGCTVGVTKNFLLCPCHGSTYDLEGKVVRGPAAKSLYKFKTEVENGTISIIIDSGKQ